MLLSFVNNINCRPYSFVSSFSLKKAAQVDCLCKLTCKHFLLNYVLKLVVGKLRPPKYSM